MCPRLWVQTCNLKKVFSFTGSPAPPDIRHEPMSFDIEQSGERLGVASISKRILGDVKVEHGGHEAGAIF